MTIDIENGNEQRVAQLLNELGKAFYWRDELHKYDGSGTAPKGRTYTQEDMLLYLIAAVRKQYECDYVKMAIARGTAGKEGET